MSTRGVALLMISLLSLVVLIINALSTALLGASNYCAQLLVAPTRTEVNNAHKDKRWLDIGIQSSRDLWKVNPKRRMIWMLLMLSSGLLHLFWNSAVFAATPFSTYNVGLVTADFLDDQAEWRTLLPLLEEIRRETRNLDPINKTDCIARYVGKTSGFASILLVSANITMSDKFSSDVGHPSSSLLTSFNTLESNGSDWGLNSDWMCSQWARPGVRSSFACTEPFLMPYNDTWTLLPSNGTWSFGHNSGFKVDHCLTLGNDQPMDHACALRFSPAILVIVTALNLFKCFCIACTVYLYWQDSYTPSASQTSENERSSLSHLVTLGDAIASFLDKEDEHTKDMDMFTKKDFVKGWPSLRPDT
ncbi:hypothetical protein G6011_01721 [Alternaria panax]|uniref:DUF6536 domain-containing protein n=1 Tax=Alternaria panax TaxID=48097 RepID=A0AAD4NWK3_9PLEO|nr:hypothetical protein G6011_01721 [Alternaria panax]